jgi:hypothetical protein
MTNNITEVGLNNMIALLRNRLPGIKCREFRAYTYLGDSYTLYDIQIMAARMAHHLGLVGYTPIVTYEPLADAAGNINLNDSMEVHINIDSSKRFQWVQVCCILAHELCHKFLYTHLIRFEGMKNELLTDGCAVYMGFGDCMVRGCRVSYKEAGSTVTSELGYLNQGQLNYLHHAVFGAWIIPPAEEKKPSGQYTDFEETVFTPEQQAQREEEYKKRQAVLNTPKKSGSSASSKAWIAILFLMIMPLVIYLACVLVHHISAR